MTTLLKTILAMLVSMPLIASAQYYSSYDAYQCRQDAAIGAAAGIGLGVLGGLLLGNGHAGPAIIGGAVGGVTGGLLGAGIGCRQEAAYLGRYDAYLSRPTSGGYYDGNTSVVLLRSGYDRFGHMCRTFHYEIRRPDNTWFGDDRTACWMGNRWYYGYPPSCFVSVDWVRPAFTVMELERFPVLYHQYRYDHEFGPNYWNNYWAHPEMRHDNQSHWGGFQQSQFRGNGNHSGSIF